MRGWVLFSSSVLCMSRCSQTPVPVNRSVLGTNQNVILMRNVTSNNHHVHHGTTDYKNSCYLMTLIIYSPTGHFKYVLLSFIWRTQKKLFCTMLKIWDTETIFTVSSFVFHKRMKVIQVKWNESENNRVNCPLTVKIHSYFRCKFFRQSETFASYVIVVFSC